MKVTKWWKKLSVAIAAAGIWIPSAAHAINIPLGDPSFEAYTVAPYVPGAPPDGYAYSNLYRPTSAWVDDLDSPDPPGSSIYFQDDGNSNWLYVTAYGEDGPPFRGAPRTGNQAMHGGFNYSAQEVSSFQGDTQYTFSIWAQGDNDAVASDDKVYLYIFDGSISFLETGPGTLATQVFQGGTDFANRGNGMTQAQSQLNWTQLSISYFVPTGSPLIGRPIGVAFYEYGDAALDDASLTGVPEPTTVILVGLGGLSLLGLRRRRA